LRTILVTATVKAQIIVIVNVLCNGLKLHRRPQTKPHCIIWENKTTNTSIKVIWMPVTPYRSKERGGNLVAYI